ncbi:MAG: NADH-quinone oxidoreductase subunit N [Chloroflexi bacterium ADurb.Bin325]|nr:MAG: NADH-quinone oxidoreductase subunit N [Chloroflexi bacterium ADurb.Bin325]
MRASDLIHLLPELILLGGAALVLLLDIVWLRRAEERRRQLLPYVALGVLLVAALGLIPGGGDNVSVATMLVFDPFALFFKVFALLAVALIVLLATPYMQTRTPFSGEFYALLLATALAICLAVSASNLVMIYLSMEFLSITSYVLAGYFRQDRKSGEAALKYFLYGATASAVMLYGMSLLYGATGTTDLAGLVAGLSSGAAGQSAWLVTPAIILLLAGFGFKASLVPFHQWAPDTYEGAPTPVTAFLSTASKATGFAILMRVFLVGMGAASMASQWISLLVALSVVTMTLGNLTALRQTNIKRLLAYSSIAQAGYILIGVVAVVSDSTRIFTGINGVLIYLLAYLFTNVGAFAVVTAIEDATGKLEIKDYSGLVRRSPWLAGLLFIFLISLTGVPPTGGFLGKFFVFGAAVQTRMWVLLAIAAVNSVVAAFYYLNIVRYMFFVPAAEEGEPIRVGRPLQGALAITAVVTVLLGLIPGPVILWASESARSLLLALR